MVAEPAAVAEYVAQAAGLVRESGRFAYAPATLSRWVAAVNAAHRAALSAGLRALPFAAGVFAAAPTAPALVGRLGVRVVIPAGLTSMALGLFLLSGVSPTSGLLHVSIAVVFMGAGMGAVIAPASESIMSVLPTEQAGVGSALNDTVQELGGSPPPSLRSAPPSPQPPSAKTPNTHAKATNATANHIGPVALAAAA